MGRRRQSHVSIRDVGAAGKAAYRLAVNWDARDLYRGSAGVAGRLASAHHPAQGAVDEAITSGCYLGQSWPMRFDSRYSPWSPRHNEPLCVIRSLRASVRQEPHPVTRADNLAPLPIVDRALRPA